MMNSYRIQEVANGYLVFMNDNAERGFATDYTKVFVFHTENDLCEFLTEHATLSTYIPESLR